MGKKCSTSGKNQYSMIEVLAKISSIMYCIIKYILKKMYAHEVVINNGGCITSHNKCGEQAFCTKYTGK